jgi:hypothetical protein
MTAREKIQGLTNSWYGYVVFTAGLSLLRSGLGFFTLLFGLISLAATLVFTWFIGNRLLAKSSLWRVLILIVSSLTVVFGTLGVAKAGWMFLHDWSLSLLFGILFGAVSIGMHIKSLRVLTDDSVKSYFD